jgi:hypothetical protein
MEREKYKKEDKGKTKEWHQLGKIKSWSNYTNNPRPKPARYRIIELVQSGLYASWKRRHPNEEKGPREHRKY